MARPRPPRPRRPIEAEMPPHEVAQLRAELEARLDHIRTINASAAPPVTNLWRTDQPSKPENDGDQAET